MDVPDCTAIAARLRGLADLVEGTECGGSQTYSATFKDLRTGRPEALLKQAKAWGVADYRYLYEFSIDASHSQRLGRAFLDAKQAKLRNRAYCRLNTWSDKDPVGTALYVGSTQELAQRMKQHFGYGYYGTPAMHLSHWLPELEGKLLVTVWRYSRDVAPATFQAIEDGLWAIRKPLLGRQGAL